MIGRLGEPDVEADHEQRVDVTGVRHDLDDRVELALARAGAQRSTRTPGGAAVLADDEGDVRGGAMARARLVRAVARREQIDVPGMRIGRDGRLPVVDHRVDRDLAHPAGRGRGRRAREVGALAGLARAALAEGRLPRRDAPLDALGLFVALLIRIEGGDGVRFGRWDPGAGERAGPGVRSGEPDAEQADDEDGDQGASQESEPLPGSSHRGPPRSDGGRSPRPDGRSLRRGPRPDRRSHRAGHPRGARWHRRPGRRLGGSRRSRILPT